MRRDSELNKKRIEDIQKATQIWKQATSPLGSFLITTVGEGAIKDSIGTRGGKATDVYWLPIFHTDKTKLLLDARRVKVLNVQYEQRKS